MKKEVRINHNLKSNFIRRLGRKSDIYFRSIELLKKSWDKTDSETRTTTFSNWKNSQMRLYGEIKPELFYTHTYLTWLMRTIRNEIFGTSRTGSTKKDLETDVFSWIWDTPDIADQFYEMLKSVVKILHFNNIETDLFKDLYEDLISKSFRVRRGEYNTPDWLAELMLERTLAKRSSLVPPRIIDPTCGTGTFIFHAIKQLRQSFVPTKAARVVGIDINPLMVEIAKTNYLLAMGKDQLIFDDDARIPVFCLDTLKLSKKNLGMLGEFDIVIGNPPWGSLRDIKNPDYQKFIKGLAIDTRLIEKKDTHLYTQIEVSTVFFINCVRFLKQDGTLAFVMPRSIITLTMQNYNFIRVQRLGSRFVEILDLGNVKPLFNMPTCVLISDKNAEQTYPIKMVEYYGKLPSTSSTLTKTKPYLTSKEKQYTPRRFPLGKKSYYYDLFKTGVCIFPRAFYFITPIQIHTKLIEAKTSHEILARFTKEPWKISLNGWIESKFVYYTLLGWEVLPYISADFRLVVLPIEKDGARFCLLGIEDMYKKNYSAVAKWFETVDKIWRERRTSSSENRFPSIFDRFNYGNLLKHQSPTRRFVVAYNATGSNITSCIVDRQELTSPRNDVLGPNDFIADVKTWIYETDNYDEALYLCGILNSDIINKMIKPFQPQGLGGARAIHRRPLMFDIPRFDEFDLIHQKIAELASYNVKAMIEKRFNGSRKRIKEHLPHNDEINSSVKKLLRC